MKKYEGEEEHQPGSEEESSRSYHPQFIKKKPVRVKVRLSNGLSCIGSCHVLWPDGRISDVINDSRPFLPLTDVTVEGDHTQYDIITFNKSMIEMVYEIHKN